MFYCTGTSSDARIDARIDARRDVDGFLSSIVPFMRMLLLVFGEMEKGFSTLILLLYYTYLRILKRAK
jgi:hypothetical protein